MTVYLDTFVFMDILSGNDEFAAKAAAKIASLTKDNKGVVSSIVLEELCYHIERRQKERAEEIMFYLHELPLTIIPVSAEIAQRAGLLRATYHRTLTSVFTYIDCIHIATALAAQCEKFITGDKKFGEVRDIPVELY